VKIIIELPGDGSDPEVLDIMRRAKARIARYPVSHDVELDVDGERIGLTGIVGVLADEVKSGERYRVAPYLTLEDLEARAT
jgi:hypothetical protein